MCMLPDTCDSRAESALNSTPGTGSISKSNCRASASIAVFSQAPTFHGLVAVAPRPAHQAGPLPRQSSATVNAKAHVLALVLAARTYCAPPNDVGIRRRRRQSHRIREHRTHGGITANPLLAA